MVPFFSFDSDSPSLFFFGFSCFHDIDESGIVIRRSDFLYSLSLSESADLISNYFFHSSFGSEFPGI